MNWKQNSWEKMTTWRRKPSISGEHWKWGENGIGARPDRRHVRSLLREMGRENCRSITTPLSATVEKEGDRIDRPEVSAELASKHRAAVARVVYLAQDRLDLGVAAVELAKTMAIPREGDNERLKRVARYLHGNPDYMQWYPLQAETNTGSGRAKPDKPDFMNLALITNEPPFQVMGMRTFMAGLKMQQSSSFAPKETTRTVRNTSPNREERLPHVCNLELQAYHFLAAVAIVGERDALFAVVDPSRLHWQFSARCSACSAWSGRRHPRKSASKTRPRPSQRQSHRCPSSITRRLFGTSSYCSSRHFWPRQSECCTLLDHRPAPRRPRPPPRL